MDTIPLGFTISPGTYLRWPCSVCGGETSKTPVLCESDDRGEYDGCPEPSIRVCEDCLRGGEKEIHSTLNAHADQLLARAQYLRSLIGRLEIPTYDEWRAVAERVDEDWCRWAGEETDDETGLAGLDLAGCSGTAYCGRLRAPLEAGVMTGGSRNVPLYN